MKSRETRMPALFIGHGSPLNAIQDNDFTRSLAGVAGQFARPRAILVVSAHWQSGGTRLTTADHPRQIYDFYGFPEELYRIEYRPAGAGPVAVELLGALGPLGVAADPGWGLDHASWAILRHMYPTAEVPVLELSLDVHKNEREHYELGSRLEPLRAEGILVVGSGNVVHNLGLMRPSASAKPYPWADLFDEFVRAAVEDRAYERLLHYRRAGEAAALAVPTDEHYLPLLYALGAAGESEAPWVFHQGIQHGSVSMTCVAWGLEPEAERVGPPRADSRP
jgi:4,5-DOPA dioxygenase extradiol